MIEEHVDRTILPDRESGARAPDDFGLSLGSLERVYLEDGHCYEQEDLAERTYQIR